MPHVHMIRHGKPASTWGDADEDPGLDETGRAQARAAAEALLALPEGLRPTAVVSSPLRRCRETAQPFADALGVPVIIDKRVGEIPTPKALAADERPAWLRSAFGGHWHEIVGDLDYDQWRRGVEARRSGLGFSARRSLQLQAVSVVHDPVEDRVRDCRISQVIMPIFDRNLTGHDRRARGMTVLEQLEQVTALLVA